jgi:guanylate kinase
VRIFISGPSGVGKSTVIKELLKKNPDVELSVSYTTRPPRTGEKDGIDYFFISQELFEQMITTNAFLEWARVHGHLYGTSLQWITSKEQAGIHILFDIDVQGVIQAKQKASPGCFIFIIPPSMEELSKRLRGRGTEKLEIVKLRLDNAKKELAHWNMYDYLVVNDSLDKTIEDISTIMKAYKSSKEVVIGELPWIKTIA